MELVLESDRFVLSFVIVVSGEFSLIFEGFIIGQMGNGPLFVFLWINGMVIWKFFKRSPSNIPFPLIEHLDTAEKILSPLITFSENNKEVRTKLKPIIRANPALHRIDDWKVVVDFPEYVLQIKDAIVVFLAVVANEAQKQHCFAWKRTGLLLDWFEQLQRTVEVFILLLSIIIGLGFWLVVSPDAS